MSATGSEIVVIGGGMVGAAIAWGLARQGVTVTVLDGADQAQRAARANFGLVWVQSKGDGLPEYALWTRMGAALWPELQETLLEETGVSCGFSAEGGLHLLLSEEEVEDRRNLLQRMHNVTGPHPYKARLLDRAEVEEMLPGIGPSVVGAGFCEQDGHASPHGLLQALHRGILKHGGRIRSGSEVTALRHEGGVWRIECGAERIEADSVVLAAGTGNKALGEMVGLSVPVFGLKGQILVTERMAPRMAYPTHKVRQTEAGTILLGDSKEPEAGFDDRSSSAVIRDIADRCVRMFPWLADVNLVRAWGGIRTMTPDGFPVYETESGLPGLFVACCHSGVTLAAAHALTLAPMIAAGALPPEMTPLSSQRFSAENLSSPRFHVP